MDSARSTRTQMFEKCKNSNFIANLINRVKEAIIEKKVNVQYKYLKEPSPGEIQYIKSLGYRVSHTAEESIIYVDWL